MKLDKKSKIFIIVFFSIILIPVIVIDTINYTKEHKLKNRIENSKATRTLTLNNISTAITLDELFEIETSKEYIIKDNELKMKMMRIKKILQLNTQILCSMEVIALNPIILLMKNLN